MQNVSTCGYLCMYWRSTCTAGGVTFLFWRVIAKSEFKAVGLMKSAPLLLVLDGSGRDGYTCLDTLVIIAQSSPVLNAEKEKTKRIERTIYNLCCVLLDLVVCCFYFCFRLMDVDEMM